jgi:hypothetical protein
MMKQQSCCHQPCINMKSLDNIIDDASSTISQESNSATTPLPK